MSTDNKKWSDGWPRIQQRVHLVNQVRNEIERSILEHPRLGELTSAEIAYILSELAFRWSLQAVKAERGSEVK